MNKRRAIERLQELVASDLQDLAANTILPDGRGYLVFEIYSLQPDGGAWRVCKHGDLQAVMTGLRSAISWCVADKYDQHSLSTEIRNLDQHKLFLESAIRTRGTLNRRIKNATLSEAVLAKIDTRRRRLQEVDQRLAKCINVAKYWQLRGFNNETARAGRTASYRTHR